MKKLISIVLFLLAVNVKAQNPVHQPDTVRHPNQTDSIDFAVPASPSSNDSAGMQMKNGLRRDSIQVDDRKPPKTPRK